MLTLLLTFMLSTADAQAPDAALKAQAEIVSACYADEMKKAVAARPTPAMYESAIHKACAPQEEKLNELVKTSAPAALQRRYVIRLRERSVLAYFYILQRLVPLYKDQCAGDDYNCVVKLDT